MASSATRRCSVHFGDAGDEKQELDTHSNEILIQRFTSDDNEDADASATSTTTLDLHLGFLQIYHRYIITCDFKSSDLPLSESIVQRITEPPNLNCRLLKIESKADDIVEVHFEFLAHKDKLVRETLFLEDSQNPEKFTKVILEARVLGKGKGTPLLKNGIHCAGKFADPDESDVGSDWQGFK